MSVKTFDQALDFLPGETARGKGPFERLRAVASAIAEGLEAQRRYQQNRARGMEPSEAASKAFDQTYQKT